jgi:hypothetical protein
VDDHARSVDDRAQRGRRQSLQTGGSTFCKGVRVRNLGSPSHCITGSIERGSECVDRLLTTKSVDQFLHGLEPEEPIDAWKLT